MMGAGNIKSIFTCMPCTWTGMSQSSGLVETVNYSRSAYTYGCSMCLGLSLNTVTSGQKAFYTVVRGSKSKCCGKQDRRSWLSVTQLQKSYSITSVILCCLKQPQAHPDLKGGDIDPTSLCKKRKNSQPFFFKTTTDGKSLCLDARKIRIQNLALLFTERHLGNYFVPANY